MKKEFKEKGMNIYFFSSTQFFHFQVTGSKEE